MGSFPPGQTHKFHICFKSWQKTKHLPGPADRLFLTESVFQRVHHHLVDPQRRLLLSVCKDYSRDGVLDDYPGLQGYRLFGEALTAAKK